MRIIYFQSLKISWLLFYFVKTKTISSIERKGVGRDAEVSEAKERSTARKRKEKETEKGKIKVKKNEKNMWRFFSRKLVRVI